MKSIFILFALLFSSVTVLGSTFEGKWEVTYANCWFNHRGSPCDNQTPMQIEILLQGNPQLIQILANKSQNTIPLKQYGTKAIGENNAYAYLSLFENDLRFEEVIYKNWKPNNTWVFGKLSGDNRLYLTIGRDFSEEQPKVYYLSLKRLN